MLAIGFIDIQRDFMNSDGALYVPGAEELKAPMLEFYKETEDYETFFTVDDHIESDSELTRNGGPFPDHCMRGTSGQQIIVGDLPDFTPIFTKNGYDVFDQKLGNPNIRKWLKSNGINRVLLVGIALDYCVKAAAFGLSDLGIKVVVASNLTRGIAEETIKETLMEFHRRGIGYAPTWTFSTMHELNC